MHGPLGPPQSVTKHCTGRDACVIVLDGDRASVENFFGGGGDGGDGALSRARALSFHSPHHFCAFVAQAGLVPMAMTELFKQLRSLLLAGGEMLLRLSVRLPAIT